MLPALAALCMLPALAAPCGLLLPALAALIVHCPSSLVASLRAKHPTIRFYLAADNAEAYAGLSGRFGDAVVVTKRDCAVERCDFRDVRPQPLPKAAP